MAEGKGTHTVEQEKGPRKRLPWWKRLWGWTKFGEKSGWEYLELLSALAIPVVLAVAGYWFTMQQDARQQRTEEQRAQDLALQGYLDQMGTLMLEDLSDPKVQTVMRARTLAVLRRLDPSRKGEVMQFLIEAELVQRVEKKAPIINLSNANLIDASLRFANLSGASLSEANLSDALLSDALLSDANLWAADLSDAYLSRAYLSRAYLGDANLIGADLRGARGWTVHQLSAAKSLKGATMPNGQKYEDWLKSKGSGEDGENSGPS